MTKVRKNAEPQGLPQLITHEQQRAVSARELYRSLGYDLSNWPKWYRKNIVQNPFAIAGQDYFELVLSTSRTRDFALTLDFAKKLAMQARTERGEQVRDYFLECEERLQEAKKPRTQIELLLQSVQLLHEQEKQVHHLSERVTALETNSASLGYYSIAGYAALTKRPVNLKMAAALGAKATAACRTLGAITGTIPDPRFGRVKTYPGPILADVFNEYFGTDARGVTHTE